MQCATMVSISIVVYALVSVIHEALGHALMALMFGVEVQYISSVNVHISYEIKDVPVYVQRLISAAGSGANILTALLASLFLRGNGRSKNFSYFLWLFVSVSSLLATGYLGFSAAMASGDWMNVVKNLPHTIFLRTALFLASCLFYWYALKFSVRHLKLLIGNSSHTIARCLVLPAYLSGGILFCVAAAFNPESPGIIIWAAAASFGAMSGVVIALSRFNLATQTQLPIDVSYGWIVMAICVAMVFVSKLGPGIFL
jgi:hypothetical protein